MATYMSGFTIISKKHGEGAATKDYNSGKAMVETGPFKFVEWIPGDRIVYTRNDEYWGEKPEWEKVSSNRYPIHRLGWRPNGPIAPAPFAAQPWSSGAKNTSLHLSKERSRRPLTRQPDAISIHAVTM